MLCASFPRDTRTGSEKHKCPPHLISGHALVHDTAVPGLLAMPEHGTASPRPRSIRLCSADGTSRTLWGARLDTRNSHGQGARKVMRRWVVVSPARIPGQDWRYGWTRRTVGRGGGREGSGHGCLRPIRLCKACLVCVGCVTNRGIEREDGYEERSTLMRRGRFGGGQMRKASEEKLTTCTQVERS